MVVSVSGRTRVIYPATVPELLQAYRREPSALIFAGGTFLLSQRPGRFVTLPTTVLSLQGIDEMRRISRSERNLELGAAVPLQSILRLGTQNLPAALQEALHHIGPPAVRGLATLGGNLAIPGRLMTAAPVLALLDARVEIRRHGNARWVPAVRLHGSDGSIDIEPGEVIARVRVPLYPWNVQAFRRFGSLMAPQSHPLAFCGLARLSNNILEELRVVGSTGQTEMLRYKEIESELVGRRLPLAEREIRVAVDAFGESGTLDTIQRDRFQRLIQWFLLNLQSLSTTIPTA